MKKLFILIVIMLFSGLACGPSTGKNTVENAQPTPKTGPAVNTITEKTNIHYTGRYCSECHEQTPVYGGDKHLKFFGNYEQLCWCHSNLSDLYHHPSDIAPSAGKKIKIPADFPLKKGKLTCDTCHDIYLQCQKRLFQKTSLRGAPYQKRTDFCYKCHDRKNYQKLNPHVQLDKNGKIIVKKCLFCHKEKPDEKHETYKEVTFIGNIEIICQRCHMIAGNHSGNFDHLTVKPSGEGLARMKKMEKKFNIILPLDKDGKMTCITCHNPHQKGVIPADKPSATGADSKYRHRLPGKLCKECHQK
ncbi:MAG: hypothetical protein GXP53_03435 [Deltaproteobacteria bacterium]|nr:hypothetical protein [Deltaproteobacteria bacterium]